MQANPLHQGELSAILGLGAQQKSALSPQPLQEISLNSAGQQFQVM